MKLIPQEIEIIEECCECENCEDLLMHMEVCNPGHFEFETLGLLNRLRKLDRQD